ncbi:4Fe-4S dicluster domain-containing protein [Candidatus Omnitrophota bacterium]
MRKLVIFRRISQTFFLLLFVYILWSTTYPLKGFLPPETFFRTNPLIMFFTSISERLILPGIIFAAAMIVLALVLGRFYCGWICPLGTMIDLTGSSCKKKVKPTHSANRKLRKIKFILLGIMFVFALAGFQVAWTLDPMGIMARFVSLNLIPTVTLLFNKFFILLIRNFEMYGAVYDLYRGLKASFLGIRVHYFYSSGIIFAVFVLVCGSSLFISRFWCRVICPLGALYALTSKFSLLRRVVDKCISCGICASNCRTGAILDDLSYVKSECVLCMDCVYDCPEHATRFAFSGKKKKLKEKGGEEDVSRKNFLFLLASSLFLLGFKNKFFAKKSDVGSLIRPPAALKEGDFFDRCIRCGNCMKVCPTNGLQPTFLQAGLESIWTPHLVPEIGYCEYHCTLCGNVCPTGAIPRIAPNKKLKVKLGTAKVDRAKCIAWAYNTDCIVCEEHCPIPNKAIKLVEEVSNGKTIKKPVVDPALCIGCGICQTKCPARPARAIIVNPKTADRT